MRWDRLFDDLEAQFAAGLDLDAAGELADLTRAERAGVTLPARLEAQVGGLLGWWLGAGVERLDAVLLELGSDWVLLGQGRRQILVPLRSVSGVAGLGRAAVPETGAVVRRLSLGTVLRRMSRDRVAVVAQLAGGGQLHGTIDRVAADHVDLAEHLEEEFRRAGAVLGVRTVPWHALLWVSPL